MGLSADRAAFQILIPENLRFQRSDLRQDRPAEPLTADRERNGLGAGVGVSIVKEHTVPVLITAALPADQGVCLFPLCRCHAVKGTVLPTLYGRQSFIWVLSHVFPPFFLSRSLRKGFLPHSCGVFRRWHAPHSFGTSCPEVTSGQSVQKLAPCGASPAGVFLFGRSFIFQGAAHR